jgi:hypothetical protein
MNRILFLIAFIFLSNHAISQIFYTDIPDTVTYFPPDWTLDSTNYFYFDLNGNEIDDFYFSLHHWKFFDVPGWVDARTMILFGNPNEIAITESVENCATFLNIGDTIGNNLFWSDKAEMYIGLKNYCGDCNCYFALKLHLNNNEYFGWIKLTSTWWYVNVEEFAYNTIPGAPILAGQTEDFSAINDIPLEDFKIYAAHGNLHISNTNRQNQINSVRIYNQMGQEVIYHSEKGYQTNIDIKQLKPGLYIIKIITEDGIVVKKHFL